MGIIEAISSVARAIGEVFGFVRQRDAERNGPEMVAAKVAQREQDAQDKTRKAIAERDIEEERRQAAE